MILKIIIKKEADQSSVSNLMMSADSTIAGT